MHPAPSSASSNSCARLLGVPEPAVVIDALRIGLDAIGFPEVGFVVVRIAPVERESHHREVCPAVSYAETAKIYVRKKASAFAQQGVWGARIAVTHDESINSRRRPDRGRVSASSK